MGRFTGEITLLVWVVLAATLGLVYGLMGAAG